MLVFALPAVLFETDPVLPVKRTIEAAFAGLTI